MSNGITFLATIDPILCITHWTQPIVKPIGRQELLGMVYATLHQPLNTLFQNESSHRRITLPQSFDAMDNWTLDSTACDSHPPETLTKTKALSSQESQSSLLDESFSTASSAQFEHPTRPPNVTQNQAAKGKTVSHWESSDSAFVNSHDGMNHKAQPKHGLSRFNTKTNALLKHQGSTISGSVGCLPLPSSTGTINRTYAFDSCEESIGVPTRKDDCSQNSQSSVSWQLDPNAFPTLVDDCKEQTLNPAHRSEKVPSLDSMDPCRVTKSKSNGPDVTSKSVDSNFTTTCFDGSEWPAVEQRLPSRAQCPVSNRQSNRSSTGSLTFGKSPFSSISTTTPSSLQNHLGKDDDTRHASLTSSATSHSKSTIDGGISTGDKNKTRSSDLGHRTSSQCKMTEVQNVNNPALPLSGFKSKSVPSIPLPYSPAQRRNKSHTASNLHPNSPVSEITIVANQSHVPPSPTLTVSPRKQTDNSRILRYSSPKRNPPQTESRKDNPVTPRTHLRRGSSGGEQRTRSSPSPQRNYQSSQSKQLGGGRRRPSQSPVKSESRRSLSPSALVPKPRRSATSPTPISGRNRLSTPTRSASTPSREKRGGTKVPLSPQTWTPEQVLNQIRAGNFLLKLDDSISYDGNLSGRITLEIKPLPSEGNVRDNSATTNLKGDSEIGGQGRNSTQLPMSTILQSNSGGSLENRDGNRPAAKTTSHPLPHSPRSRSGKKPDPSSPAGRRLSREGQQRSPSLRRNRKSRENSQDKQPSIDCSKNKGRGTAPADQDHSGVDSKPVDDIGRPPSRKRGSRDKVASDRSSSRRKSEAQNRPLQGDSKELMVQYRSRSASRERDFNRGVESSSFGPRQSEHARSRSKQERNRIRKGDVHGGSDDQPEMPGNPFRFADSSSSGRSQEALSDQSSRRGKPHKASIVSNSPSTTASPSRRRGVNSLSESRQKTSSTLAPKSHRTSRDKIISQDSNFTSAPTERSKLADHFSESPLEREILSICGTLAFDNQVESPKPSEIFFSGRTRR